MKKQLVLAAALAVFGAPSALAQTCATPLAFNDPSSMPDDTGSTCTGSDEVASYCVLQDSAGKNDIIYQFTLGPTRTATQITITDNGTPTAGFTPSVYVYSDACATAAACEATTDAESAPLDVTSLANGTYYLAVTASQFEAAGACGTYNVAANGVLPVRLETFSVN